MCNELRLHAAFFFLMLTSYVHGFIAVFFLRALMSVWEYYDVYIINGFEMTNTDTTMCCLCTSEMGYGVTWEQARS